MAKLKTQRHVTLSPSVEYKYASLCYLNAECSLYKQCCRCGQIRQPLDIHRRVRLIDHLIILRVRLKVSN